MLTEELTVQSCLARPLELVVERMVASFATSDVVSSMVSRGPVFPYHSEVISQQMASAGWCPAELRAMSDSFTGLELWRLSFLEVPHIGMNHSKCTSSGKCTAYNIVGTYVTKHDYENDPSCSCEFVYASHDELAKILLSPGDAIPLIQTSTPKRGRDKRLYVSLVPSKTKSQPKNIDWTAISHVWSDGLGNNKENAIPLCQFDRLCRLTSALPVSRRTGSSPFWLDTLCFPLQPKAAYDKALVRMKECYEDAKAVLVLDHYLLGAYARGGRMSMTEVMARIIISPWNRRLWTWQEAYLAHRRHLFFQFKDITICDEDILDAADGRWVTKVEHFLDFAMSQGFHSRFQDIRDRNDRMSIMDKIAKSKNSLTFRSTSVAPDEALALSNILGINTAVILNCKHQKDWMLTFWKHVTSKGHYHASMIFWDGPRQGLPLGTCDIYGREQDISATEMGPPRPSRHGNIHSRLAC
ncbi:het domain protein [Seiridium cupressi]